MITVPHKHRCSLRAGVRHAAAGSNIIKKKCEGGRWTISWHKDATFLKHQKIKFDKVFQFLLSNKKNSKLFLNELYLFFSLSKKALSNLLRITVKDEGAATSII